MKYNVAGIEQLSLTDWPGHVAAVLFTRGCNFRCPWCHNKALVYPELFVPLLPEDEVERFLLRLDTSIYDGVVVSGGEPLIHPTTLFLLEFIKRRGLAIRLDTNGSAPDDLISFLEKELIDEIAVDYKLPFESYKTIGCRDVEAVKRSLAYIASTGRGYIRTALIDGVHTPEVVEKMQEELHYLLGDNIDWRFNR